MPYVTSVERLAIERGNLQGSLANAKESVIDVLETRFEIVSPFVRETINQIDDLVLLKQLHKKAITVDSIATFMQFLPQ